MERSKSGIGLNLIVDVEPKEAQLLIELIETLITEWYVNREERKKRFEGVKAIAVEKDKVKKATPKKTQGKGTKGTTTFKPSKPDPTK